MKIGCEHKMAAPQKDTGIWANDQYLGNGHDTSEQYQHGTATYSSEPYSNGAYLQQTYHSGAYTNVSVVDNAYEQQSKQPYPQDIQRNAKLLQWPHEPRLLKTGHYRIGELLTNIFSILVVFLLVVYIVLLAVYDGAVVDDVATAGRFLKEISQLVSLEPPSRVSTGLCEKS